MYLKSIEIHGFKSFANKIVLDFHNGITGIVGPNGSGKSNIGDAVRWVLGEQSAKQLRGSSMQDVIFAGTENRKPMSYAYVAITLDNSDHQLAVDFNEVTIGRRVYRSGESEYLINGSVSRLKEVNELFYDTGIGKEGYSIIGQGQIDRILSGKPEERRELFDEAAGIVKFKKRKSAAVKKLDHESENLVRVNDILSELERQVGPLERQSEKARIYLKKKEELKAYDVNLFLLESGQLQTQLLEAEKNLDIASSQMEETRKEYDGIKEAYENMSLAIAQTDAAIEALRNEISSAAANRQNLENRVGLLREQIHTAETTGEHFRQRLDAIASDKEERRESMEGYRLQQEELEQKLQNLKDLQTDADDRLADVLTEQNDCSAAIEQAQADMIALLNERARIQANQQKFATMLEQCNIRKAQITGKILERKSKGQDYDEVVASYEKELQNVNGRIEKLQNRARELERKEIDWKQKIRENDRQRQETDSLFHKQESRLETLRSIAERYDGYGNSIRKVMEQKSRHPGILGVVSDLIQVERKYETAIEIALGGSIQNIVTEDEACAKEMISFLKENRFGRATFLPLTNISPRSLNNSNAILHEEGVLGIASELVKCEAKYRPVAGNLLGLTVVTDTLNHAAALARKYRYSLRIVTLEGELLNPGGSMTGGAFKNSSNLLARNRQIEELEKELKETRHTLDTIKSRRDDLLTAEALCQEELEEIRGKVQEQLIIQNSARINVEQAKVNRHESEGAYQSLVKENREIEENIAQIREDSAHIREKLQEAAQRETEITAAGEAAQKQSEEIAVRANAAAEKSREIQLQSAETGKSLEFAGENLLRIEGELARLDAEREDLVRDAALAQEEIKSKEEEIREVLQTLESSGSNQDTQAEKLQSMIAERDAMNREYHGYFSKQEEIGDRKTRLDHEIYRLTSQKDRYTEAINNQLNYMWEEYELTPHTALKYRDEELGSLTEIRKMAASIKDEIRKLGDVNVNSIEQYKEVSERYTFLKTQHDDLITAKQTLEDVIRQLDNGMRRQFTEKFAEIQKEFDRTFRQLFGGGHGSLELVEGEDILECGIRIIAQPPGKKLQNMMQLSGGEKALSAIALLFAIQSLKPSPFCLLDEIEAALDDSNVDRYAQYLKKLTGDTQFIVITHRRGTMSAADRLYGITMQEKGVSTLVSVDLIETQLSD